MIEMFLLLFVFLFVSSSFGATLPNVKSSGVKASADESNGFDVYETTIDSPLNRIYWGGGDDSTLVFVVSQQNRLYMSEDDGKTWTNLSESPDIFPSDTPGVFASVANVFSSRKDASRYVMLGRDNRHLWTTTDAGKSFNYIETIHNATKPMITTLTLHHELPNVMVAVGWTLTCIECDQVTSGYHPNVYLTTDFGETWSMVSEYTGSSTAFVKSGQQTRAALMFNSMWNRSGRYDGCSGNCTAIIAHFDPDSGQVMAKESLYEGVDIFFEVMWSGTVSYVADEFSIVMRRKALRGFGTILTFSNNGGLDWKDGFFPLDRSVPTYYTVISSSDAGIIATARESSQSDPVLSADTWSTLYTTRSANSTQFVEILPFIHTRNLGVLWGAVDIELAQGVDGVIIANSFRERTGMSFSRNGKEARDADCLQTRMTANFGGSWGRPRPPLGECDRSSSDCYLQLTGSTQRNHGRFYSVPGALGLFFAPGHVGQCFNFSLVNTDASLYFSNNAGETWQNVGGGHWTYEIGGHGAFLVVADTQKNTTELKYSLDEGLSWHTTSFVENAFQIKNLETRVTNDGSDFGRHSFLMYGSRGTKGVLAALDFGSTWTRNCSGNATPRDPNSDYELWSPHSDEAGTEQHECYLGAVTTYVRRKFNASCDNSYDRNLVDAVEPCECTDNDYLCDFCYLRLRGKCQLKPTPACEDYYHDLLECKGENDKVAYEPSGYILEPNNKCIGGVQHATKTVACRNDRTDTDNTLPPTTPASTLPPAPEHCATLNCGGCVRDPRCRMCSTVVDQNKFVIFTRGKCEPIGEGESATVCKNPAAVAARESDQCVLGPAKTAPIQTWGCSSAKAAMCRSQCGVRSQIRGCDCDTGVATCFGAGCNSEAAKACETTCVLRGGVRACDCLGYNNGSGGVMASCVDYDDDEARRKGLGGGSVFLIVLGVLAGVSLLLVAVVCGLKKMKSYETA